MIKIEISKELVSFLKEVSEHTNSPYEDVLKTEIIRKLEKKEQEFLYKDS